eukprot:6461109-Amphidinium_carterae.1
MLTTDMSMRWDATPIPEWAELFTCEDDLSGLVPFSQQDLAQLIRRWIMDQVWIDGKGGHMQLRRSVGDHSSQQRADEFSQNEGAERAVVANFREHHDELHSCMQRSVIIHEEIQNIRKMRKMPVLKFVRRLPWWA